MKKNSANLAPAGLSFILLIGLTVLSALLGEYSDLLSKGDERLLPLVVLSILCIKSVVIVDVFMELKTAPVGWRRMMGAYAIVISLILLGLYSL